MFLCRQVFDELDSESDLSSCSPEIESLGPDEVEDMATPPEEPQSGRYVKIEVALVGMHVKARRLRVLDQLCFNLYWTRLSLNHNYL